MWCMKKFFGEFFIAGDFIFFLYMDQKSEIARWRVRIGVWLQYFLKIVNEIKHCVYAANFDLIRSLQQARNIYRDTQA